MKNWVIRWSELSISAVISSNAGMNMVWMEKFIGEHRENQPDINSVCRS